MGVRGAILYRLSPSVGGFVKKRPGFQRVQNYVSGGIYIVLDAAAALSGEAKK